MTYRSTVFLGTFLLSVLLAACPGPEPEPSSSVISAKEQTRLFKKLESAYDVYSSEKTGARSEFLWSFKPPNKHWKEMKASERKWIMERKVMAIMILYFQQFDIQYADSRKIFGCKSCHVGSVPIAQDPDPFGDPDLTLPKSLYPLDPNNMPSSNDSSRLSRITKFMEDTVVPAMKYLMGRDDITCFTCHASKSSN